MTDIQANTQGKVQQAKKRLRRHLSQVKDAGNLSAGQRDQLFAEVLADLIRIHIHTFSQSDGEEVP